MTKRREASTSHWSKAGAKSKLNWKVAGREAFFSDLWYGGHSQADIARICTAEFGIEVSRSMVAGKAYRMELPERDHRACCSRGPHIGGYIKKLRKVRQAARVQQLVEPERKFDIDELPTDPKPGERVSLIDLQDHNCRWPLGDPRDDDFGFCGRHKHGSGSYCEEHSIRAAAPPEVQRGKGGDVVDKYIKVQRKRASLILANMSRWAA